MPADLENPTVTATYVVGEGREAIRTVVCEAAAADSVQMDSAALKEAKAAGEGSYTIVISSDNYANIAVVVE